MTAESSTTSAQTSTPILERALAIYGSHNAIQLATTGGTYSPWVLGAYYTHDGPDLLMLLEVSGKSMQNLQHQRMVAFSISDNDAMKDFLQGRGEATLLPLSDEAVVRAKLLEKMPWYQTFTPVAPVRIVTTELFVSSVVDGWFPAKKWNR